MMDWLKSIKTWGSDKPPQHGPTGSTYVTYVEGPFDGETESLFFEAIQVEDGMPPRIIHVSEDGGSYELHHAWVKHGLPTNAIYRFIHGDAPILTPGRTDTSKL